MEKDQLIPRNNDNAYARPMGTGGTLTGSYPLVVCPSFQQLGYIGAIQMNKEPQRVICPNCRTERITVVTRKNGQVNENLVIITAIFLIFVAVFLLGILGGIVVLPFALVPYCITKFYDTLHHCPQCKHLVGRRKYDMSQYPTQIPKGHERGPPPPEYEALPPVAAPIAPIAPIAPGGAIVIPCLGNEPQRLTCPNCTVTQISKAQKEIGQSAIKAMYIVYVIIMLFSLLLIPMLLIPLACIPLCMTSCKQTEHVCENCNHIIGVCRMR